MILNITSQDGRIGDRSQKLCRVKVDADNTVDPAVFAAEVANAQGRLTGPFLVAISGHCPPWGYALLVHAAHASQGVAVFDPKWGYVVVQSHVPGLAVGTTF
jgi:CRISPR-associated Csx3 family protein